ncbi:hypothetical protein PP713_13935 [Mycobacterium sp. CSUR Q5927]|nr:hypothetical protein [Mycobacterium sp. CSUR Q5927]
MDAQEVVELSLHGALIHYGVRVLDPHTVDHLAAKAQFRMPATANPRTANDLA